MAGSLTQDKIKNVFHKLVFLNNGDLYTTELGGANDVELSTISSDTSGNATTATTATNVTSSENSADETVYPTFVGGTTGSQGIEVDTGLTYNPGTNLFTAGSFSGSWEGTDVAIVHGGTGQSTAAGAANALLNVDQGGSLTIGAASDTITVAGDLQVSGATITTTTETLSIADNTIVLNSDLTATADVDAGIVVERGGSGDNALLFWDEGDDRWKIGTNDEADIATSHTYQGDVMQVNIDGAYDGASTLVPIGHMQYHDGDLYVRVED